MLLVPCKDPDSESTRMWSPCQVLVESSAQTSSCRRQPALRCTGAVYWKPALRCFHQVSQHCERDLFQRRAAETCPLFTVSFRGARKAASAAKVAASGSLFSPTTTPTPYSPDTESPTLLSVPLSHPVSLSLSLGPRAPLLLSLFVVAAPGVNAREESRDCEAQ